MSSFTATALEQRAYRDWAAGKVIPDRITTALDAQSLYGPEVDQACGVEEPVVDMWEAGTLYPTWEQLRALARLVDLPVHAFTVEPSAAAGAPVWICERRRGGGCTQVERDPVLAFTPEAIAAANLPRLPPPNPPLPPTGRRRIRRAA